jgi:hypothetical protein
MYEGTCVCSKKKFKIVKLVLPSAGNLGTNFAWKREGGGLLLLRSSHKEPGLWGSVRLTGLQNRAGVERQSPTPPPPLTLSGGGEGGGFFVRKVPRWNWTSRSQERLGTQNNTGAFIPLSAKHILLYNIPIDTVVLRQDEMFPMKISKMSPVFFFTETYNSTYIVH